MILSLTVLLGLVAALFLLPLQVFLITAVYCYSMLILWRLYLKNIALLDIVVLIIYSAIAILYFLFGLKDIVPFTGSFFYGAIGLTSLVGGVIGRPFTLMKIGEKPKSEIIYHRLMNIIMGLLYSIALYLSIVLFPSSTYIIVPIVISIVAIPLSMVGAKACIFCSAVRSSSETKKTEHN
jgi:hypothetical protein